MVMTISIGAAALMLGVCVNTLRTWHASGFLVPVYRTEGGHRRYDPSDVAKAMHQDMAEKPRATIAYARVSTHDQKKDLETQVERLKIECANRGWQDVEVVKDLGSGMNYNKKRLTAAHRPVVPQGNWQAGGYASGPAFAFWRGDGV